MRRKGLNEKKIVYRLLLIVCFYSQFLIHSEVFAVVSVRAFPSEEAPQKVHLENDSLSLTISVDWKLTVNSLKYKTRNLEFVQEEFPMPLFNIENTWSLYNVPYSIQETRIVRKEDSARVNIHCYSNYLENPFHVYVTLTISEQAQIRVKIWLENHHQKSFHDLYREGGGKTTVVPGLPLLAFLNPNPGGKRTVIFPSLNGKYKMNTVTGRFMKGYKPIDEWEQPPSPKEPVLQFYYKPAFPTTIDFPKVGMGVLLLKEHSDLQWEFSSVKEALWPSQIKEINLQDTLIIFDGLLRFYEGEWHTAFHWFRNYIRKDFDFSLYKRPGYRKYRRDFLAYHSFIFNHHIYDPHRNKYRIREFLEKAEKEVGGYDQFYFWHAYPRVGTDPRDQFDLFEDLPGGFDNLKKFISTANEMGTHVFLAYNPWDKIDQREDMYGKMAEILGKVNADGLLLDTMEESDSLLRAKVDQYSSEAQFVTEGRPPLKGLEMTAFSWDHPITSLPMPRVDLLRFIIPEHRPFQIVRWDRDRTLLIKKAFFNATGYTVWEDIFGEINLQSWDEKILISRYNRIMHEYAPVINSKQPEPLIRTIYDYLFVNGFYSPEMNLYTLYQSQHSQVSHFLDNRVIGKLFSIDILENWHIVDVWNIRPVETHEYQGKKYAFLPQEMPEDLGCFVAMPKRIKISKQNNGSWEAHVPGRGEGTLQLYGVDMTKRLHPGPRVGIGATLFFNTETVKPSTDGFVVIKYRNEDKEVKDVALVKVQY